MDFLEYSNTKIVGWIGTFYVTGMVYLTDYLVTTFDIDLFIFPLLLILPLIIVMTIMYIKKCLEKDIE